NPPPYCIVVDFPGFQGFVTKRNTDERLFPFPSNPNRVPIYRQKFTPVRRDLPQWIAKKQDTADCYREQFPLDLSRHITVHRAQGQTLRNCLVSVDLGLSNPDCHVPPDIGSIIYVACTRVTELKHLFVSPIFPNTWKHIGTSVADDERRKTEVKLKQEAGKFAQKNGKYREVAQEFEWKPDYSKCKDEWLQLRNLSAIPTSTRQSLTHESVANEELTAQNDLRQFQLCMKAVRTERHIGIDQGRRNFGIAVVDTIIDGRPCLVAAENYDLRLKVRFTE